MATQKDNSTHKNFSANRLENILLLILFTFGSSGAFYLFAHQNAKVQAGSKDLPVYDSGKFISENTFIDGYGDQNAEPVLAYMQREYMTIQGNQIAGLPLQFEIDSFNDNAKYLLDFGNGVHKEIKEKKLTFTYPQAGTYTVELKVWYKGSVKTIYMERLTIERSMKLAARF